MSKDLLPERLLLTAEEVADLSGLTVAAVYKAGRDGVIPSVRIGRRMRFDKARLLEWIAAGGQAFPAGWRKEPVAN